jgi:hypothetical protein
MIGTMCLQARKAPVSLMSRDLAPDRLVEVRDRHPVVAARVGGVVHEDVDAPEGPEGRLHQTLDRLRPTHVPHEGERTTSGGTDLLRSALDVAPADLLLVVGEAGGIPPGARDHHVGAEPGQGHRGGAADPAPAARARDQRHLAVEYAHVEVLSGDPEVR